MKQGYLSQYFKGVASKKLSEVEVNPELSHQHEFNGVKNMMSILGRRKENGSLMPSLCISMTWQSSPLLMTGP